MGCASSVSVADKKQEKLISSLEKTVKELRKRVAALEAENSSPGAAAAASIGSAKGQALASVAFNKSVPSAPEPRCVCDAGAAERAKFLSERWIPFLQELHQEYLAAATRFVADYNPEQIFPAQTRVEELAERCAELTRAWHGKRNYSTVYEWLVELHELDRHTYPYRFEELAAEHSEDGWVRIIDATMRRNKIASLQEDAPAVLPQDAGESPIDNTVLGNVMSAEEGHMLLAGGHIKGMFLRTLASKQTLLLQKFSEFFAENPIGMEHESWLNLAEASPQEVMDAIEHAEWRPDVDLSAMGVSEESVSWQFLKRHGHVVQSFNQLSKAEQKQVQGFLAAEFGMPEDGTKATADQHEPKTELDRFVAWAKVHPGQWWEGSKAEHEKLLVLALLSPKHTVLTRSAVERFTRHRFFVIPWTRRVPLITVDEDGTERVLREAGAKEHSRIRKNKFPYNDSHGLALSSGGLVERADLLDAAHASSDTNNSDTLPDKTKDTKPKQTTTNNKTLFELEMPVEPEARLGNLWLCDVEKLLHETALLNASMPQRDRLLPCEVCHEAGQNPAASSSVGNTQHMQLGRSSVEDWPLMQMFAKPMWCAELNASLDLVQVGDSVDAFLLRFKTATPVNVPLITAIQDFRLAIMREFGGHQVDFNVMAMPDMDDGDFVVTFAAIAAVKEDEDGVYNGVTQQRAETTALPRQGFCKIDSSQGKGNALLYSVEDWDRARGAESGGRKLLEALYDFHAVPGMRRLVRSFLLKRFGYIDNVYGKAKGPGSVRHGKARKTPIFGTQLRQAPRHQSPLLEQYMASSEAASQAGKEASRSETESRARLGGSDVSVSMRASDEQSVLSDQSAGKIPPFPPEPTAGPSPSVNVKGQAPGFKAQASAKGQGAAGSGGWGPAESHGAGGQAGGGERRTDASASGASGHSPPSRIPRPPSLSSSNPSSLTASASKPPARSSKPAVRGQGPRVRSQEPPTSLSARSSTPKASLPKPQAAAPLPEYSGVLQDLLSDEGGHDQFEAEVACDRNQDDPSWPSYPDYPDPGSRPLTEAESQPRLSVPASAQSRGLSTAGLESDPPSSPSVVRRWGGPRDGLGTGFGSFNGQAISPRDRDKGSRAAALMAQLPRPPETP